MDIQPIEFIVNENSEPIRLKDEAEANYRNKKIKEVVGGAREYGQKINLNLSVNYLITFHSSRRIIEVDSGTREYSQIINLNLSGNILTTFHSKFINCLPNLATLDLSNNKIENINNGMQKNHNIFYINLSGNVLTEFPFEFFNCLPNLGMLDLSNNRIDNIPKNGNRTTSRLSLNLSKNKLTEFPFDLVRNLENIEELIISKNEITEMIFPNNWISSIKRINISFNKLDKFVLQNGTFKSIEVLKLNNNELKEIRIDHLTSLKKLYLQKNEIDGFSIEKLSGLEEFDISFNRIENFDNILDSQSVKYIYLNNNNLREIDLKFINNCPKLEYVNLNSNKLTKIVMTENLNELNAIKLINCCNNRLNPFLFQIFEKVLIKKINFRHNLVEESSFFLTKKDEHSNSLNQNGERIDLLIRLFEHNQVFIEPKSQDGHDNEALEDLKKLIPNLEKNYADIQYFYFRQHGFQYFFIFFFLISNSELKFKNSEEMSEKCEELVKKLEKNEISFLDFLIEIKMNSKILQNFENKIRKSTNNETLYVEFNFFTGKSIENLCERNDSEIFDLFFPDKILKQNDSKLPYLINKQKFLSEINFERCFGIALENKNEEIATKLLLLYNLFRKKNSNKHEDYFSQDFISNFLSLIKFFSESNSNRKLDTKPIRDLANDFWSWGKITIYILFLIIYIAMLVILSCKILKNNSLNEQFKYENSLIILILIILITDILKFFFAFFMSIGFLEKKLKNIISRCFYCKRNEQIPVERDENQTRNDDHPGNNIRFKNSKNFYSFKLFFELINSILLILAVLIYPKLITISIIFVFGVFIFKLDKCPWIGKYVRVLSQIIMKSIPFLIIFVVFLFGFWISFHTLLIPSEFQNINGMKNSEKNESVVEKIIRFVIMGAGNLESDNFPISDHNPIEIFFILFVYLTFIFSIPVIVINLFGGVSNYEIKNMFDKAEFDDAIEKIQYSIILEKMKKKIKLWNNCFKTSNLMKLPLNPRSENRNEEENSNESERSNLV